MNQHDLERLRAVGSVTCKKSESKANNALCIWNAEKHGWGWGGRVHQELPANADTHWACTCSGLCMHWLGSISSPPAAVSEEICTLPLPKICEQKLETVDAWSVWVKSVILFYTACIAYAWLLIFAFSSREAAKCKLPLYHQRSWYGDGKKYIE